MSYLAGAFLCRLIATASFFSKVSGFPRGSKKILSSRSGTFILLEERNSDGRGVGRAISQTGSCLNSTIRKISRGARSDLNQEMICPRICPKCCKPMRRREADRAMTGGVEVSSNAEAEKTDFESIKDASWQIVDFEQSSEKEKGIILESQCVPDTTEWVVFI